MITEIRSWLADRIFDLWWFVEPGDDDDDLLMCVCCAIAEPPASSVPAIEVDHDLARRLSLALLGGLAVTVVAWAIVGFILDVLRSAGAV